MENCIFCKIIRGEVPTHFIYENEFVVAFSDIHPVAPGHTLVIPKQHHQWFYEVPGELATEWFSAAQFIALKLKDDMCADYVRLGIVGKDVPHAHIHLVPQKMTDAGPKL
jgi:histidine triad (HIT) family protein